MAGEADRVSFVSVPACHIGEQIGVNSGDYWCLYTIWNLNTTSCCSIKTVFIESESIGAFEYWGSRKFYDI